MRDINEPTVKIVNAYSFDGKLYGSKQEVIEAVMLDKINNLFRDRSIIGVMERLAHDRIFRTDLKTILQMEDSFDIEETVGDKENVNG